MINLNLTFRRHGLAWQVIADMKFFYKILSKQIQCTLNIQKWDSGHYQEYI